MLKFLFILFSTISLFSQTINFKESKYIDALDSKVQKFGYINFNDDSIETSYKNSNEKLIFIDDTLYIKSIDKTQEIDLNRDMGKKIYFTLLEAIYSNDLTDLKLYFEVSKKNNEISLSPKSVVANYIKSIKFKKDKKLEYLHINMLNNDRIIIEQVD